MRFTGLVISDSESQFFNKSGTRLPTDNKVFKQHEFDWYGQDSWKVRRNLTLNLGLRYQFNGVPYETSGNLSNLLQDPGSFAFGSPVTFSVVGPGSGHKLYQPDYKDIETARRTQLGSVERWQDRHPRRVWNLPRPYVRQCVRQCARRSTVPGAILQFSGRHDPQRLWFGRLSSANPDTDGFGFESPTARL